MRTNPTDTSRTDTGPTDTKKGRVSYVAVKSRGSIVLVVRNGNLLTLPKALAKVGEIDLAQSAPQRHKPLRPEPRRYILRLWHTLKPVSRGVLALGVFILLGAMYIHGFAIFRRLMF